MVFDMTLEKRLTEWGNWNINILLGNVGYPKSSPIVAIIEVGVINPTSGPKEPYLNPRAMEIGLWINRMAKDFPQYAKALELYYLNPEKPLRVIADAMKVSIRTLKVRVYDAKVWLSGRIAANDDGNGNAA